MEVKTTNRFRNQLDELMSKISTRAIKCKDVGTISDLWCPKLHVFTSCKFKYFQILFPYSPFLDISTDQLEVGHGATLS